MINRIFFITENMVPANQQYVGQNIYYSILVNPAIDDNLQNAYTYIAASSSACLTISIHELLAPEAIQFIASFLFIPAYLRIEDRPVVNLEGSSAELLESAVSSISAYLLSQGISDCIINRLQTETKSGLPGSYPVFSSAEELTGYYKNLLQSDRNYNNYIFYRIPATEIPASVAASLIQLETEYKQHSPQLYALTINNIELEKEINFLKRKNRSIQEELNNQQQYVEVLRSGHSAKELQNYYNNEYEVLPLWYKRFGHLIKVITGKRKFK